MVLELGLHRLNPHIIKAKLHEVTVLTGFGVYDSPWEGQIATPDPHVSAEPCKIPGDSLPYVQPRGFQDQKLTLYFCSDMCCPKHWTARANPVPIAPGTTSGAANAPVSVQTCFPC